MINIINNQLAIMVSIASALVALVDIFVQGNVKVRTT